MFFKSGVTSDTKTNAENWLDFKTFQTRIIISAQQNFRLKLLMIFLKWFKEWLEFETCKKSLSTKQRHSFIQVDSYRKRDTNHVSQKVFQKKIPREIFRKIVLNHWIFSIVSLLSNALTIQALQIYQK